MRSKYRNVYWYRRRNRPGWGKWMVKLHFRQHPSGRETLNVGYYHDERCAAQVADVAEDAVREGDAGEPNLPDEPLKGIERTVVLDKLFRIGAIDAAGLQRAIERNAHLFGYG